VVEGDSAALAVLQVRDQRLQAVLPMQGKPLNALRASDGKVAANPFLHALTDAIGAGRGAAFDREALRYERIVLLMDPDADGIHAGALLLLFFHRWMPALVERGQQRLWRGNVDGDHRRSDLKMHVEIPETLNSAVLSQGWPLGRGGSLVAVQAAALLAASPACLGLPAFQG
jgi:hypothetical protein